MKILLSLLIVFLSKTALSQTCIDDTSAYYRLGSHVINNIVTFGDNKIILRDKHGYFIESLNNQDWRFMNVEDRFRRMWLSFGGFKTGFFIQSSAKEIYLTEDLIEWKKYQHFDNRKVLDDHQHLKDAEDTWYHDILSVNNMLIATSVARHNSGHRAYSHEISLALLSNYIDRYPLRFSSDAITWRLSQGVPSEGLPTIVDIVWTGKKYVAITSLLGVFHSKNLEVWETIDIAQSKKMHRFPNAIVQGDGKTLLVVGEKGLVAISDDEGLTWTKQKPPVEETLYDVIWDGKAFIAVGDCSTLIRSTDGKTWERILIQTKRPLRLLKIAYTNGRYVAAGGQLFNVKAEGHVDSMENYGSTLVVSEDGKHWRNLTQTTLKNVYKVYFRGHMIIP